jgi:hypothetical protein
MGSGDWLKHEKWSYPAIRAGRGEQANLAYSVEKLTCSPERAAPPEYHPVKTRFNKQSFPVDLWEEQRSEFLR